MLSVMLKILYIMLVLAASALILSAAVAAGMFRKAICRNKESRRAGKRISNKAAGESECRRIFRECGERLASERGETCRIMSRDGIMLTGHYIEHKAKDGGAENTPDFILLGMHGYRSSAFKEFGIYADFYRIRLRADMMIPDQRAHGESGGKYICYGIKERYDIIDWLEFTNRMSVKRYGKRLPIYVHGISMGCAAVLMSYGLKESAWPDNVRGIIADCGYTSPYDIFRHIIKSSFHLPAFPILNIAGIYSKIIAGINFTEASARSALEEASECKNIPILFIHGGSDKLVPCSMTLENYNAYKGAKELFIAEKAGHAKSYYECKHEYERAVTRLTTRFHTG